MRAVGCDTIHAEKRSGTTAQGREELQIVLDFLRPGDVLMVIRSPGEQHRRPADIVRTITTRGASLKATEQPIDTSPAAGNCFWTCSTCSRSSRRLAAGAPAGRHRQGQGGGSLQGRTGLDRCGQGARDDEPGVGAPRKLPRPSASAGRAFTAFWKPGTDKLDPTPERATLKDNLMDQDIGTVCNFFCSNHQERGPGFQKSPWFRRSGPPVAAISGAGLIRDISVQKSKAGSQVRGRHSQSLDHTPRKASHNLFQAPSGKIL